MKHGGDLFAENENKDTPCDCAEKQHHKDLALNLESQMVFSRDPEAEEIEAEYAALDKREVSFFIFQNKKLHKFYIKLFFFFKAQFVWSFLQYAKYPVVYIAISIKLHLETLEMFLTYGSRFIYI